MANITMRENKEHNGVELLFGDKPSAEVRNDLKSNGFRWNPQTKVWYAKADAEHMAFAKALCKSAPVEDAEIEVDVDLDADDCVRDCYTKDELAEMFPGCTITGNKRKRKVTEFSVSLTDEGIVVNVA